MSSSVRRATRRHRCARCGYEKTYPNAGAAEARYWFSKHSCVKWEQKMLRANTHRARLDLIDRTPKPCLHKQANHQHGTNAAYVLDGCRCHPCSKARVEQDRWRNRQKAYGRYQKYVPAEHVRTHVRALMDANMGLKTIAKRSGVSTGTLSKLIYGVYAPGPGGRNGKGDLIRPPSRRVLRETAEKLYALDPDWNDGPLPLAEGAPDPAGTPTARLHLRSLVALGWSQSKLAVRLGILPTNLGPVIGTSSRGPRTLTRSTVDRIEALFAELCMTLPPEDEWRDKIAAARARNYAKAQGWLPPLALDDLDVEDGAA